MGLAKPLEVVRHDETDENHDEASENTAKAPEVPQDNELVEDDSMAGAAEQQAEQRPEELRLIEALLFAAGEPLDNKTLKERLPEGVDIDAAMRRLQAEYAPRGVNLVRVAGKWMFRTANDL